MRYLIFLLLAVTSTAGALDLCPQYLNIHSKEIEPRIRSGIPFKILSLAADSQGTYRRIVRVDFDLWSEKVGVERLGATKESCSLGDSPHAICKALSMATARNRERIKFQILLNPDLSDGLEKLKTKGIGHSGFLEINWKRLSKDLNSEMLLLESEIQP